MSFSDITFVLRWWFTFFVIGLIFLPLTIRIFSNFFDKGYIFSKIIGMALISYAVFLLGILKIAPFTELTIYLIILFFLILNIFLISKLFPRFTSEVSHGRNTTSEVAKPGTRRYLARQRLRPLRGKRWKIFLFEEIIFLAAIFFWSFIRAHQPDIHGLEKYMDFGFINSILRSDHFPPRDMWFTPLSINYYYFGHLVTAVLTKLSGIPSPVTFNLMLATLFGLTFTCGFSIALNLFNTFLTTTKSQKKRETQKFSTSKIFSASVVAGLLSGFLLSMAGNLHTIYTFFKPYANENPAPFWQLAFSPNTSPNGYWYPNATRFIHNTIHEFPIYSSVVSDLHGHYLDVPFVLLTIGLLLSIFVRFTYNNNPVQNAKFKMQNYSSKFKVFNFGLHLSSFNFQLSTLLAFMLAIMYMTNAWDGIIYLLLTVIVLAVLYLYRRSPSNFQAQYQKSNIKKQKYILNFKFIFNIYYLIFTIFIIGAGFFVFALPFNIHFKPFASGIGVLCAPEFLTNIEKLGPFLFEKDHCQSSAIWQLAILYGFFYLWAISFIIFLLKKYRSVFGFRFSVFGFRFIGQSVSQSGKLKTDNRFSSSDLFILLLITFSTLLIIIPEFIYIKDIYPGHYRANTMFKLVYQAFIMLSIASAYIIIRLTPTVIGRVRSTLPNIFNFYFVFFIFAILFFILVIIYPYFAINSYYGDLKTYYSLDGTLYLKKLYPTDYSAILWINKNIKGQPVILEAQGDSYTDYGRISTNTGLPTVLGWTVHEWLWRGSYDIPSPRIEEVQKMYESEDLAETKSLLKKYKASLVFFGNLERQKYPKLDEEKFKTLGKIIYQNGDTKIYKII